jgi:hypothetical protein
MTSSMTINKLARDVRGTVTDALDSILQVQVSELQHWDKPAFKFVYLLNKLPVNMLVSDFSFYWKEWAQFDEEISSAQAVAPIIDRLMSKGLITLNPHKEQKTETVCNLVESVQVFLTSKMDDPKTGN